MAKKAKLQSVSRTTARQNIISRYDNMLTLLGDQTSLPTENKASSCISANKLSSISQVDPEKPRDESIFKGSIEVVWR
jgi:hypothetical protein